MTTERNAGMEISLAPAQNMLNTLALLNTPSALAMRSPGVRDIVAGLTAEQRHTNRVLFGALGDGLMPDEEWPSFPLYIEFLAARDPLTLRDQLLQSLCAQNVDKQPVTPARLLADLDWFCDFRSAQTPNAPAERALYEEGYALLKNPARLRRVVAAHLRALWEQFLSVEWQHLQPVLETLVPFSAQHIARHATPAEMLRTLLGAEPSAAIVAQLQSAKRIVLVLSGHMQQSARTVRTAHTTWLFAGLQPHPAIWRRSPIGQSELLARLRPLSDAMSLDLLGLLSQHDELSAQALAAQLNLTQPTASRHLQELTASGHIMERRQGGATKVYRLTPGFIAQTFRALDQHLATASSVPAPAAQQTSEAGVQRFLDGQRRVTQWPAKRKDQLAVLNYLAEQFPAGEDFTEKQVNQRLLAHHTWNDPAYLRRELCDAHLLDRTRSGARYWRTTETPEATQTTAPVM